MAMQWQTRAPTLGIAIPRGIFDCHIVGYKSDNAGFRNPFQDLDIISIKHGTGSM